MQTSQCCFNKVFATDHHQTDSEGRVEGKNEDPKERKLKYNSLRVPIPCPPSDL
jgi:hypothetical protein